MNKYSHPFHLVDPSPWPFLLGSVMLSLPISAILIFHGYINGTILLKYSFLMVLLLMAIWWRDVIREGTFEGQHTKAVQLGLRLGMLLFIASEVMFFFSFFWAFFHSSLAPGYAIGGVWPPVNMVLLNPWKIPLLNTGILLTSGACVTWSHIAIRCGCRENTTIGLILTIGLACLFTGFQGYEYYNAPFTMSDGIYGTLFYVLTGFHGLHVLVGTLFLIVCIGRLYKHHFTRIQHLGFEFAIWYWHFVDVVWLFLFIIVYWWGGQA